jgi:hypothetical protein
MCVKLRQLLEHYAFICYPLYDLAVFGHHQIDIATYMETYSDKEVSPSRLKYKNI